MTAHAAGPNVLKPVSAFRASAFRDRLPHCSDAKRCRRKRSTSCAAGCSSADVGIPATEHLLDELVARWKRAGAELDARAVLKSALVELIAPLEQPLIVGSARPFVIMLAGVNGAGKTTSIGKLAKYLQGQGHSVLLAAGDTFRAAAREQLEAWGARNDVPVIAQHGGDPAAVMFDAISAARARRIDVVLADTAGRLPTQLPLMDELKKIRRVIAKAQEGAPHETLLVLDANTGQNALAQVAAFDAALGLTGLIVTKLDGTAKGGVVAAIAKRDRAAQADRHRRRDRRPSSVPRRGIRRCADRLTSSAMAQALITFAEVGKRYPGGRCRWRWLAPTGAKARSACAPHSTRWDCATAKKRIRSRSSGASSSAYALRDTERVAAIVRPGEVLTATLAAILAAAVVAVTFNIIRLQVLTRAAELGVASLFGATPAYMRRPFLYFGALQGLAAGLLAVGRGPSRTLGFQPSHRARAGACRLAGRLRAAFDGWRRASRSGWVGWGHGLPSRAS